MKKFLKILGVVVLLLIVAIVVLPIIFKDDIQKALDDTMAESLNAKVYYDVDKFGLSLIKNFPDMTVSMGDFGIVGVDEFANDTLASIASFEITVDLMSVITGNQIQIEEIVLDKPSISVVVLPDGTANYDIAKASEDANEETVPVATEADDAASGDGDIQIGIKRWAINDGKVVYNDQSMNFFTSLIGLNHSGSGDFTLDVFDLTTSTVIESVAMGFEGVEYLSNKTVSADVTLNMDLSAMKFVFKDNRIALNEFAIGADGFISMPGDDIEMDITFGGQDIDLTSILSLIPGVYLEYLDGVAAGGQINFDGFVKGTFNETSMPAVAANLSVDNGRIAYSDYPIPMEQINIKTSFSYPSVDLSETSFNVDNFSMLVDGEKLSAYLKFKNLENYQWDFGFDGNADLEKITRIVPLEGMTLKGKINAGLKTAGKMSDVEAERYASLPTSGSLTMDGFYFVSADLPQGFGISKAVLTFNPQTIALSQFDAKTGNSDFSVNGSVSNYIGFALGDELLQGNMSLTSNLIDLNEFMVEEEADSVEEVSDTTALEVIRIPENIDFTFASSIKKITYTNITMNDFEGKVMVKDGAVVLEKNSFQMLDGTFELTGSYVTKDLEEPKYDFAFKIKDLSIAGAFDSFNTIQQYVPIAKQMTGKFSTDFNVTGLLGQDMMPLMDQMNLKGLVNVANATLTGGSFMNKLNTVAAFKSGTSSGTESKQLSLKDVLINTEIRDGRLFVEPFDLEVKGQKATLGGSNTLDGALDYAMLMRDIPTGAIGNALNSALGSLTGGKKLVSDKINLNLGIGGTYDDVIVKLLGTSPSGSSGSTSATTAFKQELTSKVDDEKAKAEAELEKKKEEQRQKILSEAQKRADAIRAEGKSSADKVRKEGYDAADKLIADAGSNPIKKKVAQEAAKKLRSETDKKANAIEAEANKKADQLLKEAKEKADNL